MTFEMLLLEREEQGMKQGMKQGELKGAVKVYRKIGWTKEEAIFGVMDEFALSKEEATEQVNKYWN